MIAFISIVVILWALYLYAIEPYSYWIKKGVKYDKPLPIVGSFGSVFFRARSMTDYFAKQYNAFPEEKYVGYYMGRRKGIVLREPELIKQVMLTDFNKFYPRALNTHKEVIEPMLKNLFFADGDLWKLLRQRMTPAFTSGKLKAMFPLIVERTERLKHIARTAAASGAEVDARDLMARYTTDFIGACGFGIDTDSINNETSTFRKLGKRIFTFTFRDAVVAMLKMTMPELFKNLTMLTPEIERNTLALVQGIMQQRNYTPSGRNDFVDLLLELKQKGKIVGESIEKTKADGTPATAELELDDLLMAAQVFVFFAAGFETSSSATSYTLHQLAFHPEAQRKCQQEIDDVLRRYDNKLCYEAVSEMKYLDMCLKEGMRLFPSLGWLKRRCERPYLLPGTSITIDPDVDIIIPVNGLHRDPQYWDEPDQFVPERFENGPPHKFVYLPFGEGPRACVGERLGRMQSLAGLAVLLRGFSVAPGPRARREPPRDPTTAVVQSILGGIPLLVRRRHVADVITF